MTKKSKNLNVKAIEFDEYRETKLERMSKARQKTCHSKQDRETMELGYQTAMASKPIPEEYKDSIIFKSGYDRGVRTKKIQEYEKDKKIIEQMVKENIPLSEAPERIQNDESLVNFYSFCQLLKTAKDKSGKTK